mgnify:CR=1 FL=1
MAPELQLLIVNATIVLIAYLGIYPSMRKLTLRVVLADDHAVLTALALGTAGALFWGTGIRFRMLLFTTNWAVFSLVSMQAMEFPLLIWFCRKHGIDFGGRD